MDGKTGAFSVTDSTEVTELVVPAGQRMEQSCLEPKSPLTSASSFVALWPSSKVFQFLGVKLTMCWIRFQCVSPQMPRMCTTAAALTQASSYGSQKSLAFTIAWLRAMLQRPSTKLSLTSTMNMFIDCGTKGMDVSHFPLPADCEVWSMVRKVRSGLSEARKDQKHQAEAESVE